jgi:hypothetical protein
VIRVLVAATDMRATAHKRLASREEGGTWGKHGFPMFNQLLRIEEELGDNAVYPGWGAFSRRAR